MYILYTMKLMVVCIVNSGPVQKYYRLWYIVYSLCVVYTLDL